MRNTEKTEDKSSLSEHKNLRKLLQFIRHYLWLECIVALLLLILLVGPTMYAKWSTRHERFNTVNVPDRQVAIVFGAGITDNSTPTPYLKWRVETAAELYKNHKVEKILMTADNSRKNYDEPTAMKKLAINLGVAEKDIVLDYAGFNTYDSCYRAHAIFQVKQAILVTQGYHLPRALMTCNGLGVDSIGVAAAHDGRDFTVTYIAREFVSTDKAMIQLIFKPHPTALGTPIPIE